MFSFENGSSEIYLRLVYRGNVTMRLNSRPVNLQSLDWDVTYIPLMGTTSAQLFFDFKEDDTFSCVLLDSLMDFPISANGTEEKPVTMLNSSNLDTFSYATNKSSFSNYSVRYLPGARLGFVNFSSKNSPFLVSHFLVVTNEPLDVSAVSLNNQGISVLIVSLVCTIAFCALLLFLFVEYVHISWQGINTVKH